MKIVPTGKRLEVIEDEKEIQEVLEDSSNLVDVEPELLESVVDLVSSRFGVSNPAVLPLKTMVVAAEKFLEYLRVPTTGATHFLHYFLTSSTELALLVRYEGYYFIYSKVPELREE